MALQPNELSATGEQRETKKANETQEKTVKKKTQNCSAMIRMTASSRLDCIARASNTNPKCNHLQWPRPSITQTYFQRGAIMAIIKSVTKMVQALNAFDGIGAAIQLKLLGVVCAIIKHTGC